MALFSRSKTKGEEAKVDAPKVVSAARATDRNIESIILKPLITEKAMMQNENRVYTFLVQKRATKHLVRDAVIALYNVTPVSVNIVNKAPRATLSRTRGRMVSEAGYKKAYVYLKAGDTINLV